VIVDFDHALSNAEVVEIITEENWGFQIEQGAGAAAGAKTRSR
jgi:hypothetical protein